MTLFEPSLPLPSLKIIRVGRVGEVAFRNKFVFNIAIKGVGFQVRENFIGGFYRIVRAAQKNKPLGVIRAGVKEAQGFDGRLNTTEIAPLGIHMWPDEPHIPRTILDELRVLAKIVVAGDRGITEHAIELPDQALGLLQFVERIDEEDEADGGTHNRRLGNGWTGKKGFMVCGPRQRSSKGSWDRDTGHRDTKKAG